MVFFLLFLLLPFVFCDENQLRPAAIIPWSQYQRRLSKAKQLVQKEDISLMSSDPAMNSFFNGNYEKPEYLPKQLPRIESSDDENTMSKSKMRNVIRPQIRGRLPAEPSDFMGSRKEFLETRLNELSQEIDATTAPPTLSPRISMKMRPKQEPSAARIPSVAIPNGVPMYAASWENGQPRYLTDRKPLAHAVSTYNAAAPQWSSLTGNEISAPVYEKADANIVSSIFSQSQARTGAIQSLPQTTQTQAYFEKLLADGASLEHISKLAKNLLGVGGGGDNGGGGGGLFEAMTSALRGGPSRNPPTSSAAHDELTQQFTSSSASRPQPSMFEKLLNQAATALNDSLNKKQLQDKAEQFIMSSKKPDELPKEESKMPVKITKDRENSLKLLENMPAEQRKMLEAAILSGEIDADSPAIKTLVKDDLTEESKKEKENRLIEWIRANRPSKSSEIITVSDKLPYYGKHLGSLAENLNLKKKLHPSGIVWAVNDKKLIVSKFVFQPGSLLHENVTFWLGPKKSTASVWQDFQPSENGFYVKPMPIDMSVFVSEELPAIEAKPRENVNAVKLLGGVLPVVSNNTRKRRSSENEETNRKPIELIMEGGIVKLEPGKNDMQKLSNKEEMVSAIPAGFRLKQPEDDNVDSNTPQPLDWYAGFQPLLITLPPSKSISDVNWLSLRDHKRNETVASLLIPNGPAFQVPKVIQLIPFSPNSLDYNISSGSIQIIDIKTIRILNFSFQPDDDSVWFMIGKDIIPNVDGHIVPLFDPITKRFDCQSLKSYHNETVTLRLPGRLDMKDVFWFSVFSAKKRISYSHLYIPYQDMQLEPDLSSTPTPTCKYNKVTTMF